MLSNTNVYPNIIRRKTYSSENVRECKLYGRSALSWPKIYLQKERPVFLITNRSRKSHQHMYSRLQKKIQVRKNFVSITCLFNWSLNAWVFESERALGPIYILNFNKWSKLTSCFPFSPVVRVPTTFLVLPNFHSCFLNNYILSSRFLSRDTITHRNRERII